MMKPLPPEMVYRRCDPGQFSFQTTAELDSLDEIIGQARAVEAIQFGIGIPRDGYNLFSLGPAGTGKHYTVRHFLNARAATETAPPDWCYVNNFEQPQKPNVIGLPAGQGVMLRHDMEQLVEELRSTIPAAFETDEYRTRKQAIEGELKERHEKVFGEIKKLGEKKGVGLLRTPTGFIFAPVRNGEVIGPEEFEHLPPIERERLEADMAELQQQLQTAMREAPRWEKEGREKVKALDREVTNFAVGHLIEELRRKYAPLPQVVAYLNAMQQDMIEYADQFLSPPENPMAALMGVAPHHGPDGSAFFRRYRVNLVVDHSHTQGAPVVYEDHPTYSNLAGQVEYTAQLGALVTDFNLIRPGALHRANGGYLMLDAHNILTQPYAWEGLKRALRSSEIQIESLGQMLGIVSTVSLEPEPIPLKLKVILVGERQLYYLLSQFDPEFNELFKVAADFEESMARSSENALLYARMIGTLARNESLLPFDRTAVARVVEHSVRVAGDSDKLSTHGRTLVDLLRESDYWARQGRRPVVCARDVQQAIDAQLRRLDRLRERYQEEIQRGAILVDTAGETTGQVNGLSVIQLGQFSFGHPSRITCRVRLGKGEVIDIEREVELGGPIHSKGVLILSGFLGGRYSAERPLSLSASLVFEQSYGGVEGDSASSAELYALLSALADAPVRQSLAVTGSVNQHGQVQAIGGVNEKIEGFFDVCKARGLTGRQGVLIPASNVRNLMLRHDVVQAIADGMFNIYPVETIDEGIEILTGIPAGQRDAAGQFPEGSLNRRVEARLMQMTEKRRAFEHAGKAETGGPDE